MGLCESGVATDAPLPDLAGPSPWMWLIAGPNGSGKSTFVENGVIEAVSGQTVLKLNPDHITRRIVSENSSLSLTDANYKAAAEVERLVDMFIRERRSFAVETVLSSDKYKPRVEECKKQGYRVALIFIVLASVEDSLDRIRTRVALGGHDVPREKVAARWERSVQNLSWFAVRADFLQVFDNTLPGTVGEPVLLASRTDAGPIRIHKPKDHPRITQALREFAEIENEPDAATGVG